LTSSIFFGYLDVKLLSHSQLNPLSHHYQELTMTTHRRHDSDDGFDEDSLFDDEEFVLGRASKWRDQKPVSKPPKGLPERNPSRHDDRGSRRRELASVKAWGTPY
jgi:hypothetical protein